MTTLFFDTETTGKAEFRLPPEHASQPHIVQLGAILCDDARQVVAELNLLIKPTGWTVPDEAAAIHGITTDRANKYGVDLDLVIVMFAMLVERADLVVAHNMEFDSLLIRAELARIERSVAFGLIWDGKDKFCTMKAATPLCKLPGKYGDYKWPKLQEAHVHFFSKEFVGAHDAMADIRACRDIYFAMQPHPQVEAVL